MTEPLRVLFLCTGNWARSQMAEATLRQMSHGSIVVASAGSAPEAEIHPMARQALAKVGIEIGQQHPKSWDQFIGESFDYVITVCDRAAERCPVFPGDPERLHWSFDDPAAATGSVEERQRAFDLVAQQLVTRMRIWLSLPAVGGRAMTSGDAMSLRTMSVVIAAAVLGLGLSCARASSDSSIRLSGAGSTFAYPLYSQWSYAFGKVRPDIAVDYQSIGSGGGIGLVTDGRVDFGATDGPMTDAQIATFVQQRGCGVLHLPMALGADVAAYNIPDMNAALKFTPRALAGIYLGAITKWNDPELVRANPKVPLPNSDIAVVHRTDSSGTTYVWTDYLAKVDDEWERRVGRGTSVKSCVSRSEPGACGSRMINAVGSPRRLGRWADRCCARSPRS